MKSIVIPCLIFLLISLSYSQQTSEIKIVGDAQREPSELISTDMRDANGDVCAGLIIRSDLKGLYYQSNNGIVRRDTKPGEDFLFLSPEERVVSIYCEGYTPLQIIFTDLSIKLKSGQTWSIKITGEKKVSQADKELFEIVFTFNTENVYAGYNNFAPNEVKEKTTTFKLPKGVYIFRFSKDGYNEQTQQIEVVKNISQAITLQPSPNVRRQPTLSATISITSDPTGGEILLNGQQFGITNKQDIITAGEYRLEIRKPMYQTDVSSFTVKAAEQKQINRILTPKFGYLVVASDQPNSAVVFDSKPIGLAPVNRRQIESGHHTIRISSTLYHDYTEEFDVKDGETKTITAHLKPAFGSLEVTTQPEDGAAVFLDGEQKGTSPVTLTKLPSGKYILKVTKQLYNDAEEQITIFDSTVTRKLMKLSQNFGELSVTADSSLIYLGGKRVGRNSYFSRLLPGTYSLRAERGEQFSPDERQITLAVGEKKNILLEPIGKFGEVYVFTTPQKASNSEIYINNTKKGNAPLPLALLIGNYTLTAKKEGYLDYSQSLAIQENSKQKITIEMITYEGSRLAKRDTWGMYKWISAVAAVGAGAATYYFNSKADSYYNEYQKATTTDLAVSKRNRADESVTYYRISSGAAITFGVSFLVTWIVQGSY